MWSLCHEVQSKVFLNPKKGTLYHKFGSNEKANTPGLHLLWGILMNYAKWKANKKISQFILRKMILASNKKCSQASMPDHASKFKSFCGKKLKYYMSLDMETM